MASKDRVRHEPKKPKKAKKPATEPVPSLMLTEHGRHPHGQDRTAPTPHA